VDAETSAHALQASQFFHNRVGFGGAVVDDMHAHEGVHHQPHDRPLRPQVLHKGKDCQPHGRHFVDVDVEAPASRGMEPPRRHNAIPRGTPSGHARVRVEFSVLLWRLQCPPQQRML